MKIHLNQIPPEGLHVQGEDSVEILDFKEQGKEVVAPIFHDVMAYEMNGALLVQGKLWTRAQFSCTRCLKTFEHDLRVTEFLVHHELKGEELVDLTPEVREDILLALPDYPVCRVNCRGLCPVCGQDLNERSCRCNRTNINPAWAALDEAWAKRKNR